MTQHIVFISGGTSGINLGIAKGFAAKGAKLLVFGRDGAKADAATEELRDETGATVMAGSADVRDPGGIALLFQCAAAKLGAPTVVIAGAAGAAGWVEPALAGPAAGAGRTVAGTQRLCRRRLCPRQQGE